MPRYSPEKPATLLPGYAALRRGRTSEPGRVYLLTTVTRSRHTVFHDPDLARLALDCFTRPALLATNHMLACIVMPDHVHWLLQIGAGQTLAHSVSRLKSASAREINNASGRDRPVWERGYHEHALRIDADLEAAGTYLIMNPVRAGLVGRVEEYPFWMSIWH